MYLYCSVYLYCRLYLCCSVYLTVVCICVAVHGHIVVHSWATTPRSGAGAAEAPEAEHSPEIIALSHRLGATWRAGLAQATATQPSAGSASPCRDRTRACGRPGSNAPRIKTIHRHWRRFQAHRLLHGSAVARPPGRRDTGAHRRETTANETDPVHTAPRQAGT